MVNPINIDASSAVIIILIISTANYYDKKYVEMLAIVCEIVVDEICEVVRSQTHL